MGSGGMHNHDNDRPYRRELEKPLEEIKENIFFPADNFEGEAWYEDLMLYKRIGVCHPDPAHIMELQKALKIMGYRAYIMETGGKPCLTWCRAAAERGKMQTVELYRRCKRW